MANRRTIACRSFLTLALLCSMAGLARAEESIGELRARIAGLDSKISGLASVVPRVEGRPGEAWVLWHLARLHDQRAEAHLQLHAILNPPPAGSGDLVMGFVPPAEFVADREAYQTLCRRLITRFAQTSAGAEAALDLGITYEQDCNMDEAGALYAKALELARDPRQVELARFFRARWLTYQAARGKSPEGYARALELIRPVAAGTSRLTARAPCASGPLDVRRQALWLTGACLAHTGRPEQLREALKGGGLGAAERVRLLEDLAGSYVCWRKLPFSAAALRILLAEQPTHESAPLWRSQLIHVEAEIAAGRTGGCHYDFSGHSQVEHRLQKRHALALGLDGDDGDVADLDETLAHRAE